MRPLVFGAWLLVGCRSGSSPDQGTVVGNPGESKLTVAAGTEGETARARTHVAAIEWEGCSGDAVVTEIDAEIDLMDDDPIEIPAGTWCGAWALLDDPLDVEVEFDDVPHGLVLSLDVSIIALQQPDGFVIDEHTTVLELGHPGWFVPFELGDIAAEDVRVDDDHPDHDDLVDLVSDGSALFEDGDADGEISEQEREDGPMATGEVHPNPAEADREEKEEAGTSGSVSGCGSESSVGWLLLPIGLLGRRRPSER